MVALDHDMGQPFKPVTQIARVSRVQKPLARIVGDAEKTQRL
jgi:hypothetical protein